jgi:hypothetical protein
VIPGLLDPSTPQESTTVRLRPIVISPPPTTPNTTQIEPEKTPVEVPPKQCETAFTWPALSRDNQIRIVGAAVMLLCFCAIKLSKSTDPQDNSAKNASSPEQTQRTRALEVGRMYSIHVKCFGGRTVDALNKGTDLVQAKDNEALTKMFFANQLVRLEPGMSVSVEDSTMWGTAKVRVRGEIDSIWIYHEWAR